VWSSEYNRVAVRGWVYISRQSYRGRGYTVSRQLDSRSNAGTNTSYMFTERSLANSFTESCLHSEQTVKV